MLAFHRDFKSVFFILAQQLPLQFTDDFKFTERRFKGYDSSLFETFFKF